MNTEFFTNSPLVETLGWTLFHSLWQIALIALVLFLTLRAAQKFSADLRYRLATAALFLAVVLPVISFAVLHEKSSSKMDRREISRENDYPALRARNERGESLPVLTKERSTIETAQNEGVFASIGSMQSVFSENFTAVLPFAVGFWFCGVALSGARLAGGIRQLRVFKTRKVSAPDAAWQERFDALCEKLKITQTVKLLCSKMIETPIVIGWFKPVILVPPSAFLQITPRELETIIAHELVHIRRYDAFVNFAQNLAEVVFFYHPCVWWISREIRTEREFAADAAVLEIFENSRIVYAKALANLEAIRTAANQTLPRYVTAANGGNLMHRICKILQKNTGMERGASRAWSAGLAFALIPAVLLAVFSFNQTAVVNAQKKAAAKRLAVGFVSIPPLDRTNNPPKDADATARLLIEKLKSHKVPAIGFLQGGMISDGEKLFPVRANIARLWRDAGFEIGIGGFRHIWFYDTNVDEYIANVEKNEQIARKILGEKNLPLRYFSYPFLNTGKTAEDRTRFESWLAARGLTPVKYTIDNQEWMYSYAYDMARERNDLGAMTEIRVAFVKYMSEMIDHYEAYSQEMFGRDIAQTLVLTPSRLVTDSADELFGMLEKRGYGFVSMEEALRDEAYKTEENFDNTRATIGKSGISWFERWQMAQGKRLRAEPKVDAEVEKIWNEARAKK